MKACFTVVCAVLMSVAVSGAWGASPMDSISWTVYDSFPGPNLSSNWTVNKETNTTVSFPGNGLTISPASSTANGGALDFDIYFTMNSGSPFAVKIPFTVSGASGSMPYIGLDLEQTDLYGGVSRPTYDVNIGWATGTGTLNGQTFNGPIFLSGINSSNNTWTGNIATGVTQGTQGWLGYIYDGTTFSGYYYNGTGWYLLWSGTPGWTGPLLAHIDAKGILTANVGEVMTGNPAENNAVSLSGTVYDVSNNPIAGATVQQVGDASVSTTTASNGTFTLAGLPSNDAFEIAISKTGYQTIYSYYIESTANITGTSWTLLSANWLSLIGNSSGKTAATGRAIDLNNSSNFISGAVVTATGSQGQSYTVVYPTNPGGTSTGIDGKFVVLNVTPGDTVTLTAAENGISFGLAASGPPSVFTATAGVVSEGPIFGTPTVSGTIWFTGWAANFPAYAPIAGATVRLALDSTHTTTTNTDGSFTLTGIPQNTPVELEITQTGYAPSYLPLLSGANVYSPYGGIPLFTPAELTAWGNSTGNGMIVGRVAYATNFNFDVSGATVTAVGTPSGTTYPVSYWGPNATTSKGSFLVFNVAPGDTVTMNASRSGFTFSPVNNIPCPSNGVTLPMIAGSAAAYVRGCVKDSTTGAGISGALVSLTDSSNNPAGSVMSVSDGSFYLGVGALGTYSITASQSLYKPLSPQSVTIGTSGQTVNAGNLSLNPGASFALSSGWNLISLPVQPANTAIASVLSGIAGSYQVVWAYPNQVWQVYDPNDVQGSTITAMQAGIGYWIKMTGPGTLSLSGAAPSSSLSLLSGWNLVGYNGTSCRTPMAALSSLAGALQVSWGYPSQGWQFYDPASSSSTLTDLCPSAGYWIKVNGTGTWTMLGD